MRREAAKAVGCRRPASNISVEVNRIVVPASDKRATAELLAYVLGLEVERDTSQFVRIRSGDGLALDVSEPKACRALQCAFLVSGAEFDAAISRMSSGAIDFYAAFDGTRRGEIDRTDGARRIYFDDPDGHLFELIEQLDVNLDAPGAECDRVRAVAIKLTRQR